MGCAESLRLQYDTVGCFLRQHDRVGALGSNGALTILSCPTPMSS